MSPGYVGQSSIWRRGITYVPQCGYIYARAAGRPASGTVPFIFSLLGLVISDPAARPDQDLTSAIIKAVKLGKGQSIMAGGRAGRTYVDPCMHACTVPRMKGKGSSVGCMLARVERKRDTCRERAVCEKSGLSTDGLEVKSAKKKSCSFHTKFGCI